MQATELDGAGIVINGGVEGFAGSTTKIASAAVLNIKGDVSNSGNMTLNGTQVELASVVNDGGDLSITSLTNEIGQITISGDVTNKSGNTDINAKDIVISGTLTNQSGILTVQGSDTAGSDLQIGAIEVAGGVLDLNALIGGVNVAGAVNVTGGALNIDSSTHFLTAANTIQINGDFILGENTEADGNGDVYVSATGPQGFVMTSTNGALNIDGAVEAIQSGTYSATFAADTITIGGNVTASGAGKELVFGADSSQQLTVDGAIAVDGGASIAIVSDDANVGSINVDANSSLIASGTQITATNGAIDVAGGLWFGGINPKPENGLIVENTNNLTLKSDNAQVEIGGALDLGAGNTLTLDAANSSLIANGNITAGGVLNANAQNINMGNITNTGTTTLVATDTVNLGNVAANSGNLNITANGTTNPNVVLGGMTVASGAVVNIGSDEILNVKSSGDIVVSGNISQGNQSGALNFLADSINVNGNAGLQLIGSYEANSGTALLEFANAVSITENVNVAEGAEVVFDAATFAASDIDNNGLLAINSDNGINLNQISNTGSLTLNSGKGFTTVDTFAVGSLGNITLEGVGLTTAGVFTTSDTILYQNYSGNMTDGMVNVASDDYSITASQFGVAGIEQKSGYMQINSSDVDISGNVIAGDLRFAKNPADTWIDATIGGNVSGGVDFWGIKRLNIAGNYTFNNDSDLWAAILPYQDSESLSGDTTNQNYWSTIEATADNKVGEITNAENGAALITIGEQFISNISGIVNNTADNAPQVGITLFDTVDQGTAIWLLHAEKGIVVTDAFEKLRNLDVKFCNADGTVCIDYADTLHPANDGTYSDEGDSPIYISERDTDGDGVTDIYGFNIPSDAPWYLNGMFKAAGADVIRSEKDVNFNQEEVVAVLETIQDLTADGCMPSNQHSSAKDDFKNGSVAMILNSCAGNGSIAKGVGDKFEYAMVTFPSINGNIYAPLGGNGLGVFKSNPEMEALAWEFVQFMTSTEAYSGFSMNKGYMPITKSSMEEDVVKARINDPFWAETYAQVSHLYGQPINPVDATIWNSINDILSIIEADSEADVAALVADTQSEIEDFLAEY